MALYVLCGIAAAAIAALSYPHWLSGFSSFTRPARAEITASNATTVRVYWEDPARDSEAFLSLEAKAGTAWQSFDLPRSKRHWTHLQFQAVPPVEVSVTAVDVNGQVLSRSGNHEFEIPREAWSVERTAIIATLLTFLLLALLAVRAARIWMIPSTGHLYQAAFAAILAASVSLFWTAVFYPALMSEDSVWQWGQAMTSRYTNWHPPIMALLMHASQSVTKNPALFTFLQGVVFWGAIFSALFVSISSARLRMVSYAVMILNPALWTCSAVLWKDVWTASFTVLAIGPLVRAVRRSSVADLLLGTACISIAACFRMNAAGVAIAPVVIGSLFVWRSHGFGGKLLRAILLLLLAVVPARVIDRLPGIADEKSAFTAQFYLPTYIGVTSRMDPSGSDYVRERENFDAVFGAGKLDELVSAYDPASGNCVLYIYTGERPILPIESIAQNRKFAMSSAARAAAKHPILFFRHKARILLNILQVPKVFSGYHRGIRPNEFGLGEQSLLPLARTVVYRILPAAEQSLLFRHYVYVAVLCVLLCLGVRRQDVVALVPALLGLCYVLSVVVVDAHPDWRYLLPTYLCAWVGLLSLISGLTWPGRSEVHPSVV